MNEHSVFQEALACTDANERERFLDRACHDDPDLRQRVEALLAAHGGAEGVLERELEDTSSFTPPRLPGTLFAGRYKLREKLGEGGMGTVYVADQLEPVQRRVALKIVKSGHDLHHLLGRFEQERQALALMDHANIAKVYDAGVAERGVPYFVMELIKGVPITKFCDDAKLTPRQRLDLFVPVCQAVQHAHQKGIIHRDLKPSNILIGLYDGRPIPKIIDFGVAKATGPRLTEESIYTEVGALIGTLEYMSPEQAELNNLDIDTRTDVYALGVILYELLTGSVPFSRKELHKAGFAEMLRIIKEVEPPKPSTKISASQKLPSIAAVRQTEPRKLSRLIRGELDWIVMKALEKDRTRRYETANGLARDVQRYLADEAVEACPPSTAYRLRKFARKNRKLLATVGTCMGMLALCAAVSTSLAVRATRAEARAQLDRDAAAMAQAEEAKQRAQAVAAADEAKRSANTARAASATFQEVVKFLTEDLLLQASPEHQFSLEFKPDRDLKVRTALDRAALKIGTRFKRQPLVEATIRETIGLAYRDLGEFASAQTQFERALELHRQSPSQNERNVLEAKHLLGILYVDQGKYKEAEPLLREVVQERQSSEPDSFDRLRAVHSSGVLLLSLGKYAEAEPMLLQALDGLERRFGKDAPETNVPLNSLGIICEFEGRLDEAEKYYLRSLGIVRRELGDENPNALLCMNRLGSLYQSRGKLPEAEAMLLKVLEGREHVLPADHPNIATTRSYLAMVHRDMGKYAQARAEIEKAVEVGRRVLGETHLYVLVYENILACVCIDQGELDRAEAIFQTLFAIQRRLGREDHPDNLRYLAHWARLQRARGQFGEAERLLRDAVAKGRRILTPTDAYLDRLLGLLGYVLLLERKDAEAEAFCREAVQRYEHRQSPSYERFEAEAWLGASLLHQEKRDEAEVRLSAGCEGLVKARSATPAYEKPYATEATNWLIQLCEASGQTEKAQWWRQQLPLTHAIQYDVAWPLFWGWPRF